MNFSKRIVSAIVFFVAFNSIIPAMNRGKQKKIKTVCHKVAEEIAEFVRANSLLSEINFEGNSVFQQNAEEELLQSEEQLPSQRKRTFTENSNDINGGVLKKNRPNNIAEKKQPKEEDVSGETNIDSEEDIDSEDSETESELEAEIIMHSEHDESVEPQTESSSVEPETEKEVFVRKCMEYFGSRNSSELISNAKNGEYLSFADIAGKLVGNCIDTNNFDQEKVKELLENVEKILLKAFVPRSIIDVISGGYNSVTSKLKFVGRQAPRVFLAATVIAFAINMNVSPGEACSNLNILLPGGVFTAVSKVMSKYLCEDSSDKKKK